MRVACASGVFTVFPGLPYTPSAPPPLQGASGQPRARAKPTDSTAPDRQVHSAQLCVGGGAVHSAQLREQPVSGPSYKCCTWSGVAKAPSAPATSQSPGPHHCRPPQLSLGAAVWLLQVPLWSFHTQAFGSETWVAFCLVLLGCLLFMQNKSMVCTLLPPDVVAYRGSLSTVFKHCSGEVGGPGGEGGMRLAQVRVRVCQPLCQVSP